MTKKIASKKIVPKKKKRKGKASRETLRNATPIKEPNSVRIAKAGNGFTISSYTNKGELLEIAKTMTEASKIAKKILGG